MNAIELLRTSVLVLATSGLIVPQSASASPPQHAAIQDVRLHADGALVGQVVTSEGQGVADRLVTLHLANRQVASVKTDRNGYYRISGLRGATYQVATQNGTGIYRAWAEDTAPPTAQDGVLIVEGCNPVRGQYGPGTGLLTNPWVVAGLLGAAIAVPIALSNDSSSS